MEAPLRVRLIEQQDSPGKFSIKVHRRRKKSSMDVGISANPDTCNQETNSTIDLRTRPPIEEEASTHLHNRDSNAPSTSFHSPLSAYEGFHLPESFSPRLSKRTSRKKQTSNGFFRPQNQQKDTVEEKKLESGLLSAGSLIRGTSLASGRTATQHQQRRSSAYDSGFMNSG